MSLLDPARLITAATGLAIGLAIGIPLGAAIAPANAEPGPFITQPVQEDDPAWRCDTMGDHVCGPRNANGFTPGLYDSGVLIASWPTIKTCANVGGDLLCDEAYVDPQFVTLVAPAWGDQA